MKTQPETTKSSISSGRELRIRRLDRGRESVGRRWAKLASIVMILPAVWSLISVVAAADLFTMDPRFLTPPDGMETIGDSHGDIAVAPTGEIYVSVQGGQHQGLQVYSASGKYLRNVPGAPSDLHGFIITNTPDRIPAIYGARLSVQQIVVIALDGRILLTIPSTAIPDRYKSTRKDGSIKVALTAVAVGPNGDIYAVDGYGRDFIHRFDQAGHYKSTFGGPGEPWGFDNCHNIAIDPRFRPVRLLCTDRNHNRLVHMDLDGRVLGVFATGLRAPGAVAAVHNELAVAEGQGRVSVLGLHGEVLASIGTNSNADQVYTNEVPPERWQDTLFYAPHGITYDAAGNLLVTEWNEWGRVVRLRRASQASR